MPIGFSNASELALLADKKLFEMKCWELFLLSFHMQENGEHFFPCWFKLRSLTSQQQQGADHWLGSALVRLPDQKPPGLWEFTGSYWEAKQRLDWSHSPDIYSGGPEADEALPSPAVTV